MRSLAIATVLSFALCSCAIVPETGRRQLTLFSDAEMNALGAQSYTEITKEHRVITSGRDYEMLQRVGTKIAKASGRDYQWEFKLLDAPKVANAFCLPGGKIAVYTGILPITQNEDGMAVIIGHEVAHATSNHGNERMSQQAAAQTLLGGAAMGLQLSEASPATQELILGGLGAGASIGVLLPFSREHETEADEIGLIFAIRAGYDPEEAPRLWERMAKLSGGSGPEFLSTHPDPGRRAERLRAMIPELRQRAAEVK